jgi:hypothetical protein
MFSVYDGDFTKYIRDFIATMGVFNGVVALVKGEMPCAALLSRCPWLAKRR